MERGSVRHWPRVTAGLLVGLVVAGGLALWLAVTALNRGWVDGPAFTLRLGDYHLIARTTTRPECLPLTQHECFVSFPNPGVSVPPYYTVWAGRIERMPALGMNPGFTISAGRQLLKLPVLHDELAVRR